MQSPAGYCGRCDRQVSTRQARKPGRVTGRYRAQYVYQCRTCRRVVEPSVLGATSFLDFTMTGQRIGDRTRPLKPRTMARIEAGIDKYWAPLLVPVEGRDGKTARPVDEPVRTMTTRNETGLALPAFIAELRGTSTTRPASEPLSTVTAGGFHHALVTSYNGQGDTRSAGEPLSMVTTHDRHALLMPGRGTWNDTAQPAPEPARTITTGETTVLVTRRHSPCGNPAQMTTPAGEPLRTVVANLNQSLLSAAASTLYVDDVYFRMLEPAESKLAQAFPASYTMSGTRRVQQVLAGNAVPPPCARDLIQAAVDSL